MALKVCAEHGCGALQPQSRCAEHRSQVERERGTKAERGYDAKYLAQLKAPEYVSATHCTACGCAFTADNPKTGGHSKAIRHGGFGSKVVAQCRTCNYGWSRTGL